MPKNYYVFTTDIHKYTYSQPCLHGSVKRSQIHHPLYTFIYILFFSVTYVRVYKYVRLFCYLQILISSLLLQLFTFAAGNFLNHHPSCILPMQTQTDHVL